VETFKQALSSLSITCKKFEEDALNDFNSTFSRLSMACRLDEEDAVEILSQALTSLSITCPVEELANINDIIESTTSSSTFNDPYSRIIDVKLANTTTSLSRLSFSSCNSHLSTSSFWSNDSKHSSASSIFSGDDDEDILARITNYDFNDRSSEARNARLANAILALDEEIPMDIDESIQTLIDIHALNPKDIETFTTAALVTTRTQNAVRRASRPRLPISKQGLARKGGVQMHH
jgi:hypothetical protein